MMLEVGLGTACLPGKLDAHEYETLISEAIDSGVTFIDTAPLYGPNELLLGQLPDRHRLRICTKVGLNQRKHLPIPLMREFTQLFFAFFSSPTRRTEFSRDDKNKVFTCLAKSLERLKLPNIDTYLYHSASDNGQLTYVGEFLTELRAAGLVKRVGFSADEYFEADTSWCDVVQVPLRGIRWFDGNFDIIVNRIFAENGGGIEHLREVRHAKRLVTLLVGTTSIEHLLQFQQRVNQFETKLGDSTELSDT